MSKLYSTRHSLNAGEVSPLVSFRDDISKYDSACLTLENAVPLVEGGAKKMPGTYFAGATANGGAMFTGSISETTLTVTEVNYGVLRVGQTIAGTGVAPGTVISAGYSPVTGSVIGIGISFTQPFFFGATPPTVFITIEGDGNGASASVTWVKTGGNKSPFFTWTPTLQLSGGSGYTHATAMVIITNGGGTTYPNGTTTYTCTISGSSGEDTGLGGVGTYTVSIAQTVASEQMQTAASGKSRLVPFQFSTLQGSILEFSAGIVRIWEGASQGSWSLGLALQTPPTGSNYDPATAYVADNLALVGPYAAALYYTENDSIWTPHPSQGVLMFAAPYGSSYASPVQIAFTRNSTNVLSVTSTGSSPNQGINIALAYATAGLNTAAAIQAGIRALGTLNSVGNNYVDLSGWTVTPDPIYETTPWNNPPTLPPSSSVSVGSTASFIAQCVAANTAEQFPVIYTGVFNAAYWTNYSPAQLPIELTTPYLEADLFSLDCSTQSADVLWIFHPNYPPAVIERLGANSWAYSLSLPGQETGEPPYRGTLDVVTTGYSALGQNISLISQSNPCIVVLASSSATQPFQVGNRIYINEGAGLVELNEGEFLVKTIAYGTASVTVVDATGKSSTVTGTGWYMTLSDPDTGITVDSSSYLQYTGGGFAVQVVAMFATAGNYPACGTLYQQRLCVGGSNNNPTQMNGSVEDDYPDFICDPNEDDYGIQFTLVSNQVNQLLNMIGTPNALLIGTSGGVWVMAGSDSSSLSQINVNAAIQSTYGVSQLQPQLVNGSAIFVSRSARIVSFLVYNFTTNAWDNSDLTRLNRNITLGPTREQSGIAQTAFQVEPYPIFWAVRNDGQLIGLVFNTQDQVYAWFRVNMTPQGGYIESAAVISGSGQEDQLAVVVRRTINGVTQRFVEYFMPQELFGQISNAFFVHCGLQLQGLPPVAITGISNANPTVVQATAHGFTNGMTVQITGVEGMTQINQAPTQAYTVANATTNSFQLSGMDSTLFDVYTGGGTATQVFNQVTGMSYLLGNNVVAVGDGAIILEPTVVTSDEISFPYYANLITIGIPYQMIVQPTNPVLSSQASTTRGMPQKLNRATLSLYESMGGQYGTDFEHLYDIDYGPGTMAKTPQMSTFEVTRDMDCDWSEESTFYVVNGVPLPFTLRGMVFRMSANQD